MKVNELKLTEQEKNDLRNRFDDKCIPITETGCWIWTGHTGIPPNDYGRIKVKGKNRIASRIAYMIFKKEIPHGMSVCHLCDTPSCVNPDHLFLGTHADNMRDSVVKGRNPKAGSKNGQAKLSEQDVIKIRHIYNTQRISQRDLAKKFNVSGPTVNLIVNNRIWQSI